MSLNLSKPQTAFFMSKHKYTAAVAGFGSGKTFVGAVRLMVSALQYPKMNFLYIAPTYGLIRDIFYPTMDTLAEMFNLKTSLDKMNNRYSVHGLGTIICRSADRPEKIIGFEAGDALIDELDILPMDKAEDILRRANSRCRMKFPDKKRNQIYVVTTPEGFKATYKNFKREPLPDSKLIQMSTYSNQANLPEHYISDLVAMYPPQLVEAYINGEFTNLTSGRVYPGFHRDRNHVQVHIHKGEPLHIGMDFNVTKMSAAVAVKRQDRLMVAEELVDIYDTPAMIMAIKEKYPRHKITVYPDSSSGNRAAQGASKSSIVQLRQADFRVLAHNKNPAIKDRVASLNGAIENARKFRYLLINTDRCPTITEALETQVYDKNGLPAKDGILDHHCDGVGYMVHKIKPVLRRGMTVKDVIGRRRRKAA